MTTNHCPLCGSKASSIQPIRGPGRVWNIGCDGCGLVLYGKDDQSQKDIIRQWNSLGTCAATIEKVLEVLEHEEKMCHAYGMVSIDQLKNKILELVKCP